MNITLPDSMRDWIENQARLEGHNSPESYVVELLRDQRERLKHEIDQQLIEGLESGDSADVNEEFWTERGRLLEERTKQHRRSAISTTTRFILRSTPAMPSPFVFL
jgi:antitoxin ParD1/3/4